MKRLRKKKEMAFDYRAIREVRLDIIELGILDTMAGEQGFEEIKRFWNFVDSFITEIWE